MGFDREWRDGADRGAGDYGGYGGGVVAYGRRLKGVTVGFD